MKVVLERNCSKKVKTNVQKKTMLDIGISAYVEQKPKIKIEIHRMQKNNSGVAACK